MMQKFFELLYRISLKGMNFGQSEVTKSGEQYVLEHLKEKNAESTFIIFDVGANKGQYANLAHQVFGNRAEIYSYEPGQETFKELRQNTEKIGGIHLNNFAFGEAAGERGLYYDVAGSGLASFHKRRLDHFNIKFDESEKVIVKTIDNFCRDNNISRIDLLKLDIEGHELDALRGAHDMIERGLIKNIQFEFGGANIDSRTYFQDFYYLLKDKYKIYRILRHDLREIKQYAECQEIFITVNYLAQLK